MKTAPARCGGGRILAAWPRPRQNGSGGCEIAQHVVQDAAVLEVLDLVERIDAAEERHFERRAVGRVISASIFWRGLTLARPSIATVSSPLRPSDCQVVPVLEGERHDAHADEVGAMDALERLRDHGLDAEQVGALGRPVARRAVAVFDAGEHDERHALGLVAHRGIVDRHVLAGRIVDRVAAFLDVAVRILVHEVLDADVGEGAAHHHFMVAAPRAVLVEVGRRTPLSSRYLPAGEAALIEPAGEMWSVVILSPNRARMRAPLMSVIGFGVFGDAVEVGRVLHVGRAVVPA